MAEWDHNDLKSQLSEGEVRKMKEDFERNSERMIQQSAIDNFDFRKSAFGHFEYAPTVTAKQIEYKFNEAKLLSDIKNYIDSTYNKHYNTSKLQAFEEITDAGYGLGFAMGNVTKYNKRYGKKAGRNRDDLMKMIHYSILALYVHDLEMKDKE